MSYSERIAIAAHLHVALRRKAGRVTDTDWMAVNDEYAREILKITRAKAQEDNDASLLELAQRLEQALVTSSAPPPPPLVQRVVQAVEARKAIDPAPPLPDAGQQYIGGLR